MRLVGRLRGRAVIGGMTGVLLAVPPVDFVLHNSAFWSHISIT
jgi:heme/copper-type cytochrome/quinol oxidase subunit 1